jgi:hypothetical protein
MKAGRIPGVRMPALPEVELRRTPSIELPIERISSPSWTWFFKRLVPMAMFVVIGAGELFAISQFVRDGDWSLLLLPLPFAAGAFIHCAIFSFPLADEVVIDNEDLCIRNGRIETRIPFARIVRVVQFWQTPETIRVEFDQPSPFGRSIHFAASPQRFWCFWFWDHPLVARLRERAKIARSDHA